MTVYSQHSNRGKVQVLATYRSSAGLTSATVTSVDSVDVAAQVVDALNRISACATVTMSTRDQRSAAFNHYPTEHLQALLDPEDRVVLGQGAHSLWYEYVKSLLQQALGDLDRATAGLPGPVQTAINQEVRFEGQQLDAEWRLYTANEVPAEDIQRIWDSQSPTVLLNTGMAELAADTREGLDEVEKELTEQELSAAVDRLRLLADARHLCTSGTVRLEASYFTLTEDPFNDDRYFVEISAPRPQSHYRDGWTVEIQQWIPDPGYSEEYGGTETAEAVLTCALPATPSAVQIAGLLTMCSQQPEILSAWAKTAQGEALGGTPFVVTERHDGEPSQAG